MEGETASGFLFSRRNLRFIWPYLRMSKRTTLYSLVGILTATVLSVVISLMVKEILELQDTSKDSSNTTEPKGIVPFVFTWMAERTRPIIANVLYSLSPLAVDLVTRAGLLLIVVLLFHYISFLGHYYAYKTSRRVYFDMASRCSREVLSTIHPERLSTIEASQVTSVIFSASWCAGELTADVLTEVMHNFFKVITVLGALMKMSPGTTVRLMGLYVAVISGHSILRRGMNVLLKDREALERYIHGILLNASRVVSTIFVFERSHFLSYYVVRHIDSAARMQIRFEAVTSLLDTTYQVAVLICPALGLVYAMTENGSLKRAIDISMYFLLLQHASSSIASLQIQIQRMNHFFPAIIELRLLMGWLTAPPNAHFITSYATGNDFYEPDKGTGALIYVNAEDDVLVNNVEVKYPVPPPALERLAKKHGLSGVSPITTIPNWKARAHRITALYGPSGCGKSSSLRLLCGLLKPTSGVIRTHANARMLEQDHCMIFGSVAENILLERIADEKSTEKSEQGLFARQKKILADAMEKAGCTEFIKDPFHTFINNADHPPFSGGQQQRICLARVFADGDRCSLVLFDEPTTGLDSVSSELVLTSIKELRDRHHKTVIVATHDPRVAEIADDVIQL